MSGVAGGHFLRQFRYFIRQLLFATSSRECAAQRLYALRHLAWQREAARALFVCALVDEFVFCAAEIDGKEEYTWDSGASRASKTKDLIRLLFISENLSFDAFALLAKN